MMTDQSEQLKLTQEELEATSTVLTAQQRKDSSYTSLIAISSFVSVVTKTSAKYPSNKNRIYCKVPRFLNSMALYSTEQTGVLKQIGYVSSAQTSLGKRAGKFVATSTSKLLTRLPSQPVNICDENSNRQVQRHQKLQEYLDLLRDEIRITGEVEFSENILDLAWLVWKKLREHFMKNKLCLEVPDACPGQKDNFMYTWSEGEHYLECEIFGNGEIEFFYRNRKNGRNWAEDTTLKQPFSKAILEKVELFTQSLV
jgi:hypothetical protein